MKAFIQIALEEKDAKTETLIVVAGRTGETIDTLHAEKGLCVVEIEDGEKITIGADNSAQLAGEIDTLQAENMELKGLLGAANAQIATLRAAPQTVYRLPN